MPIKQAGRIKRAGWNFPSNFKNEQVILSEEGEIFMVISESSRFIKASREE